MLFWASFARSTVEPPPEPPAPPEPLEPAVPRRRRRGDLPLDVRREDVIRVEIRDHRFAGRGPRDARGALDEGALVQAHEPAVAARFELAADELVDRRPAGDVIGGAAARRLVQGAGQHARKAGVAGRLAVRPVAQKLVVDPVEQQKVGLIGLQRGLERRELPVRRVRPRRRPAVSAAEHPVWPRQDVEALDSAGQALRVGGIRLEQRQQRHAGADALQKLAPRKPEITLHHDVSRGPDPGHTIAHRRRRNTGADAFQRGKCRRPARNLQIRFANFARGRPIPPERLVPIVSRPRRKAWATRIESRASWAGNGACGQRTTRRIRSASMGAAGSSRHRAGSVREPPTSLPIVRSTVFVTPK